MKVFLYIILGVTITSCAALSKKKEANPPDWAKDTSISVIFPTNQYYHKVSSKKLSVFPKSEKEGKEEMKKELEADLVKEIFEKISFSSVVTEIQSTNKNTVYISSAVNQSTRSASLNLMDKKFDFYTDHKKGNIIGILYVKKSKLAENYKQLLSGKINELNSMIESKTTDFNVQKEKLKYLSDQMEVYSVIKDPDDAEIESKYSELLKKYSENNDIMSEFNEKINNLITTAEELYSQKNYAASINKFNEVLLRDPTNEMVLNRKKEVLNECIAVFSNKISIHLSNNSYKNALTDLDYLRSIDRSNEAVYKMTQQNIVEKSIDYIREISKKGLIVEANKMYEDITPYFYTNDIAFKKLKVELDLYDVKNAIKSINNSIYEADYEAALILTIDGIKKYPNDNSLSTKMTSIEEKLLDKKKTELLNLRSTRWILELNYSLAVMPVQFQAKPETEGQKFNTSNVDTKNLLPHYQIGLYKKVAIRDIDSDQGPHKKHRFSYSQFGVRAGFLNAANYPFVNPSSPTVTYTYDKAQLLHLEASYIWHSFLMFNVGYLMETSPEIQVNNTIKEIKQNYLSSTIGVRLPFSNPFHLTGEVTGFTQDGKTIKAFAKAGISWNIGFGRKYTREDEMYIKEEIAKIKNF